MKAMLYFHNDEPNRNTRDTTTTLAYSEAYDSYKALSKTYVREMQKGLYGEEKENAKEEVDEWWHNSPLLLRFLYILIPVLLLLFLCCCIVTCCCGCPAWCFKGRDEKEEYHEEHHETHVHHEGPPPEDGYKENGYYDDGEEDPLAGLDEEEDDYTMGDESQEQPRSSGRGGRRGRAPDSQSGTFA